MGEKFKKVSAVLVIYIISLGISYFVFSSIAPSVSKTGISEETGAKLVDGRVTFDPNAPKTEECPINGIKYSREQKDWWEEHRPLGIMIENHEEARPQSGLIFADAVYEIVAEGGITRFLAIYYCQDAGLVGPVRSARTYFLDFISEYGGFPLYAHVGGANTPGPADALSQISDYDWTGYNDLNQFSIGFPTFWRDYNRLGHPVATEHTMYSATSKLWDFAKEERELAFKDKEGERWDDPFVAYKFKEDLAVSQRPQSQSVRLEFWKNKPDYVVDWKYDPATNLYIRENGGKPYTDKNNNGRLSAKNVVVLSMIERNANDGYEGNLHLLYRTKGTGRATIFMDGEEINGTWRKDSRTSRTIISASDGSEVKFNRGVIWFEVLPTNGILEVI